MEQSKEINEWLEDIGHETGDTFHCDAKAVVNEVSSHDALFSNIGIKILSIIGGFVAGVLFLVFLFLSGILESETSMAVTGVIFIIGTLAGSRLLGNHTFLDASIISIYILGCVLMAIGSGGLYSACSILIMTSLVTLLVTNKYVLVFISILLLNGSIAGLYFDSNAGQWLHLHTTITIIALICICFGEAELISSTPKINRLYKPVVMGLFVSLAAMLLAIALQSVWDDTGISYGWVLSLFTWAGIMFLVMQIMRVCSVSTRNSIVFYILAVLILLPTLHAPAISVAVFMILLSFRYNYKPAFVMSIALLIYALIQYYYDLSITLLAKSGFLFFSGMLFLAMWLLFRKMIKNDNPL